VPPAAAAPFLVVQQHGPSKTAVAGLVVGSLALLGVVGMAFSWLVPMFFFGMGGFEDMGMSEMGEYELVGTLPQATPGRTYTGEELIAEVERVLEADYSTFRGLECGTLDFAVEAEARCTGTVDGMDTDLLVVVDDELGHFTLIQSW